MIEEQFCSHHSAHCVRLEHVERRVCRVEKMGLKILISILVSLLTTIGGFLLMYAKLVPLLKHMDKLG